MTEPLDLGCFSVSLSVNDLDASVAFYGALGFEELGGGEGYKILGNGPTKIGLFQGMFENNILTFNPGLAQNVSSEEVAAAAEAGAIPGQLDEFTDVRVIEQRLIDAGIEPTSRTETPAGPGHITLTDPDGNQILIDQFF